MVEFTLAQIAQYVGKELGVSSWATVDQSRINQFAECSGDRQWFHIDVERAERESPYRAPIEHGYLMTASRRCKWRSEQFPPTWLPRSIAALTGCASMRGSKPAPSAAARRACRC